MSRGIDYLGALARTLGDLTGYSILAFELIQNADDASASQLVFTFRDHALEVWNDGEFSDCRSQELSADECPMLTSDGHRCDFHSFRLVSSEDKRRREGTIGAFGIGFTAVYQVTDRPELISSGRHWLVDETNPESDRIQVCPGCPRCDSDPSGTTFILPWALDDQSPLRVRLSAPAVGDEDIDELRQELLDSLPTTVLFLRNLDHLEVRNGDTPVCRISRHIEDDTAFVQVNDRLEEWLLLSGSFTEAAQALRARHGEKIEASRHDEVVVAVPVEHPTDGRLCAYLPTRESTGLPFHVNADFFPASDRTRLPSEGYRGEWNRAATHAAARVVADRLEDLRQPLGPRRLWDLIHAAWQRRPRGEEGDTEDRLGLFWSELAGVLSDSSVFHTSAGEWVRCSAGITIRQVDEEGPSIPLLEHLELKVVDPVIHSVIYSLPRTEVLGTRELTLASFVESLRINGFASPDEVRLPEPLLQAAWRELDLLLARPGADPYLLDDIRLAPTRPGGINPFDAVRRADEDTRRLFESLPGHTRFLDEDRLRPIAPRLAGLVEEFDAPDAVTFLESLATPVASEQLPTVLRWFSDRAGRVDEALARRLAAVPIFPTSAGPRALVDLSIPGGFDDELGLAEVVDIEAVPFALSFLKQLGARELTIEEYASRVVPANTGVAEADPNRWRRVVELLAKEGGLRDTPDLFSVLSSLPLVETDRSFETPLEAYFPSDELDRVLVEYVPVGMPVHTSVAGFYEWLGVASVPRPADLMARVEHLAAGPVTTESVRNVEAIVAFLAEPGEDYLPTVQTLARRPWLPAEGDDSRWYEPAELAAGYRRYLFETQARFIRLPMTLQRARGVNTLFETLGVRIEPEPDQVVDHLLESARRGMRVNNQVYRYLNDHTNALALDNLADQPCILTPDGRYLRPNQLFRRHHPFGRFRSVLGDELRGLDLLWERLAIQDSPEAADAVSVLVDIGDEYGAANDALDDEALSVVMEAWRIIESRLMGSEEVDLARLEGAKCIPDTRRVLLTPDRILFDDAPEYADALRARIGGMLIRKPEGAWRAMTRLGVRSLAEGVEVELHEASDEVDDHEVRGLITERSRQVARAIDPLLTNSAVAEAMARLEGLTFTRVSQLEVVYRLRLSGSNVDLRSEILPATTVLVGDRILRSGESISAVELARELAKSIAPTVERASLVPALALALQPGTAEDADRSLDSAGVPRLDAATAGTATPAVLEGLGGLGGTATKDEYAPRPTHDTAEPRTKDPVGPYESRAEKSAAANKPRHGEHPKIGGYRRPEGRPRKTFLRSYVSVGGESDGPREENTEESRSETDAAGIAAVLAFERSYGRLPTEMPHDNPGYDIESREPDGSVSRYIEVKSLTGDWRELGAGISARQYREAVKVRDRFWLYVVENATSDPQIYPIQDPVGRVDQFMFDDNWKLVADARRRPLTEIEIKPAVGREPAEGWTRVPIVANDPRTVHAWKTGHSLNESVDIATGEVHFVIRTDDGELWPIGEPPHDRDRSGRLLLLVFERNDGIESTVGWYRAFTSDDRVAVDITPETQPDEPILLFPDYESDIAAVGEVLGRGVNLESDDGDGTENP